MDDDELKIWVLGPLVALVLIVAIGFGLSALGLLWDRPVSKYAEETRAQTYDSSRQYRQGINRDLARYCRQWRDANGAGKSAVADLIRSTSDTFEGTLTADNARCIKEIR